MNMNKLSIILLSAASAVALAACGNKEVKPMETPKDRLVAQLFDVVKSGKILYGHQDDLVYGHAWKVEDVKNDPLERSDVKAVTGAFPAIVGFDLGGIEMGWEANLDGVSFDLMRRAAVTHAARGGVVTFSWHPRNPLTGGDAWDVSSDQVVASILEGGEKHDLFLQWLGRAADFLETLKDADGQPVAVLFRPWHEHTGSWFWWGENLCSEQQYKDLFRMTYGYLTGTRGLTNLVWVYSPGSGITPQRYMSRYPGDEFVDMLGSDDYQSVGGGQSLADAEAGYIAGMKESLTFMNALAQEHEKLMCLSETGFEGIPDPSWWTSTLLPAIQDFPIAYVLTWRNAHDKPGHFYAAWPESGDAADFKAFAESDNILMLNE